MTHVLNTQHLIQRVSLTAFLLFALNWQAYASRESSEIDFPALDVEQLIGYDGQAIEVDETKLTHLVFQEIWNSYEGKGEEARVNSLPVAYKNSSQLIWVQPGINVTEAQMKEYQEYFPNVTPLILDRGFQLLRNYGNWQLPLHVIFHKGKPVFSGTGQALTQLAESSLHSQKQIKNWLKQGPGLKKLKQENLSRAVVHLDAERKGADAVSYYKPKVGDRAPLFSAQTLTGDTVSLLGLSYQKPLSLVFLDSLCPMPHFPNCEKQLLQLNELVAADDARQWLGVVSSFYVNKDVVQQFSSKFKLDLPLVFDNDNQIYQAYGVYASPYQVDIGRDGNIRQRGSELH